ncbi:Growth-regulating factor 5 [Bienertia sinuspersici]
MESISNGYGKKIDPEPGRCRRTDGKKWRCSKEAYPDSKYCERHMHRGKNRSRKPVESPLTTTTSNHNNININNNNNNNHNNNNNNNNSATNSSLTVAAAAAAASLTNQSLLTKNPSAASSTLFSLPSSDSSCNSHLLYPHASSYNHKDYNRERYYQGIKEEVGEHAFFTESSGSSMRGFSGSSLDESWQLGNLDLHHHHHQHQHQPKQSGGYLITCSNFKVTVLQQSSNKKSNVIFGEEILTVIYQ